MSEATIVMLSFLGLCALYIICLFLFVTFGYYLDSKDKSNLEEEK